MVIRTLLLGFAVVVGCFALRPSVENGTLAADTKEEKALKADVAKLQSDLKRAAEQNLALQRDVAARDAQIAKLKGPNPPVNLQPQLDKAKSDLATAQQANKDKDAQIAALKKGTPNDPTAPANMLKQLQAMKNAPYVHHVVLKLKKDAPIEELQALLIDLPVLAKVSTVRGIWYGPPAEQATPDVAVTNYDIAITVLFDNFDGLKAYFTDAIHQKFVDKHMKYWEPPVVYDYYLKPSP